MICSFCAGELSEHDRAPELVNDNAHYYCMVRSVIGSVGHQLGKCSCFGGSYADPPGMTKQQAAIAAFFLNLGRHRRVKSDEIPSNSANCEISED